MSKSSSTAAPLWSPRPHAFEVLRPLYWLHFPKTGSSLTHTIFRFACPESHAEILRSSGPVHQPHGRCAGGISPLQLHLVGTNYHTPLRWLPGAVARLYPQLGRVVALFRSPAQRLLSSFKYMRAHPSCCSTDWGLDPARRAAVGKAPDAAAFARSAGALGCMTKMVLGFACFADIGSTRLDLGRARALVRSIAAYVGLQEDWTGSVCLFHARFGGALHAVELSNNRPTTPGAQEGSTRYNESELGGVRDTLDEALYKAASQRFARDLQASAAAVAECRRAVAAARAPTSHA